MFVTKKMLEQAKACNEQVQFFAEQWPDGVEVTAESVAKAGEIGLDLDWFAEKCLPGAAWEEYEKVCASAWEEYSKVSAPALAEYDRVRWAERNKVRDSAWEEYKKVRDAALAEYKKACAAALVKACQGVA